MAQTTGPWFNEHWVAGRYGPVCVHCGVAIIPGDMADLRAHIRDNHTEDPMKTTPINPVDIQPGDVVWMQDVTRRKLKVTSGGDDGWSNTTTGIWSHVSPKEDTVRTWELEVRPVKVGSLWKHPSAGYRYVAVENGCYVKTDDPTTVLQPRYHAQSIGRLVPADGDAV